MNPNEEERQLEKNYLRLHFGAIEELRQHWGRFLALGIALILLGMIAMAAASYTTLFSVIFLGSLMAIGGLMQIVHSFLSRQWTGFFLAFLAGVLYLVTGILIIVNPMIGALTLTLLLSLILMVTGIFRMGSALLLRFSEWGWVFFSGFISFVLGILIVAGWPVNGIWILGLFIGIDLIFYGWSWVIIALVARRIKA